VMMGDGQWVVDPCALVRRQDHRTSGRPAHIHFVPPSAEGVWQRVQMMCIARASTKGCISALAHLTHQ
jgi:hypothetical protein